VPAASLGQQILRSQYQHGRKNHRCRSNHAQSPWIEEP
jgi:hypothetical protein